MRLTPNKRIPWLVPSFILLLAIPALLLIPGTNRVILGFLGLADSPSAAVAYNGFDAFIPFIPGYFPDNFEITHARNASNTSAQINTYTETYASETHFFKTIQSQGPAAPEVLPDPGFTIQNQPASQTSNFDLALLMADDLDLSQYNTQEVWLVSMVLKNIHLQLVTNLPGEEAIAVAEGLIPSICTSTPTPWN